MSDKDSSRLWFLLTELGQNNQQHRETEDLPKRAFQPLFRVVAGQPEDGDLRGPDGSGLPANALTADELHAVLTENGHGCLVEAAPFK